jgi:signal peptidase I
MGNETKSKLNLTKKQKDLIKEISFFAVLIILTFTFMPIMKGVLKTDYPLVVVTSGSMEPNIYRGDLLVIEGKSPADIEVGDHIEQTGDIILYDAEGLGWDTRTTNEPIVHRCISRKLINGTYYFEAQGDNLNTNQHPDPVTIPEDHILGVVRRIVPKIGWPKIWLSENGALSTILIVGLSILLLISIVNDIIHPEEKKPEEEELKTIDETDREVEKSESELDLGT